jgi:hypothetical protein
MVKAVPKGYMQDSQGRLVPEECVKDIERLRDTLVREIISKANDLSKKLADFKTQAMSDINAFVSLSAEKYGVKMGGQKGNLSLLTYDGEYRLIVAIADTLVFDERLQAAKELIDECLRDWSEDSRVELKTVLNGTFDVDKTGNVNTKRILSLRKLEINDERWKRAMEAISDSLTVAGSKAYIRVYQRTDNGEYKQINLDLASL